MTVWLVGAGTWLENMTFHENIGNGIVIPFDEVIFFRGVEKHQPGFVGEKKPLFPWYF